MRRLGSGIVCHTGHEFSADSLAEAQNNGVESALGMALRTLKERAMFLGGSLQRLVNATATNTWEQLSQRGSGFGGASQG